MTAPPLALLNELIADAWPPALVERLGSWRLRWAWGITRRANSVLVLGEPPVAIAEVIARAERFYREHQQPALFQVSDASPPLVVAGLEAAGFVPSTETRVCVTTTSELAALGSSVDAWRVVLHARPSNEWFATYWHNEGTRWTAQPSGLERAGRVYRSTFLRPRAAHAFAEVWRGESLASVGQVVLDRGWAGFQCVVTVPEWRGQGAASALLGGLARWAHGEGATQAYLGVLADNAPALAAYQRVGFEPVHAYRYWGHGEPPDATLT